MKKIKKLYTVTDLGPGDGGKGGVVHKISSLKNAHTILKVGGAQGSHGVTTSAGDRFAFSQFGCGTFEGVRTHLTPRMVASPEGLLNEGNALYYERGIRDVFDLITMDEDVICATPFHGIASRLKELSRRDDPRGTIGTGVGEAYRFSERYPSLTIRARDLKREDLRELLAAVREMVIEDTREIIEGDDFLSVDRRRVAEEVALLNSMKFLDFVVQRFREAAQRVKVVDGDHLRRVILGRDGVVVVESSHGVLTDHYQGFHPHTSAIRTLPRFTHAMLDAAGYDGEIVNLGVSRAYQIRHGAGPMPTATPSMGEDLLPGSHKEENRYQGTVRVGPLDLVLLRYAINCAGGPEAFQGLAITWFDQVQKNGSWQVCDRYRSGTDDPTFFTPSGELHVRHGEDTAQLLHQERLGHQLRACVPKVSEYLTPFDASQEKLYRLCAGMLGEQLRVDVRMVSFGASERDKICR